MVINEISSQRRQDSNWGFDEITCKLEENNTEEKE